MPARGEQRHGALRAAASRQRREGNHAGLLPPGPRLHDLPRGEVDEAIRVDRHWATLRSRVARPRRPRRLRGCSVRVSGAVTAKCRPAPGAMPEVFRHLERSDGVHGSGRRSSPRRRSCCRQAAPTTPIARAPPERGDGDGAPISPKTAQYTPYSRNTMSMYRAVLGAVLTSSDHEPLVKPRSRRAGSVGPRAEQSVQKHRRHRAPGDVSQIDDEG